jgi:hypothetical protein
MSQIGRNLAHAVGFVKGQRYLIHDCDPLFSAESLKMLSDAGAKFVKLPPRSPDLGVVMQVSQGADGLIMIPAYVHPGHTAV